MSVIGFLVFSFRCLAVTRFDPDEATAVFIHSSLPDSLRAILLQLLPSAIYSMAIIFAALLGESLRQAGLLVVRTLRYALATVVLVALVFVYSDSFRDREVFGMIVNCAYFGAVIVVCRLIRHGVTMALGGSLLLAVLLGLDPSTAGSLTSRDVWLSREKFVLADRGSIEAYVLEAKDGQLFLLDDRTRRVFSLPEKLVEGRTYCRPATTCYDEIGKSATPTPSSTPR